MANVRPLPESKQVRLRVYAAHDVGPYVPDHNARGGARIGEWLFPDHLASGDLHREGRDDDPIEYRIIEFVPRGEKAAILVRAPIWMTVDHFFKSSPPFDDQMDRMGISAAVAEAATGGFMDMLKD
jgi:hypothetical protein